MFRPQRLLQYTSRSPLSGGFQVQTQARTFWRRTPRNEPQVTVQPVRIRTWYSPKRIATYALYAVGTGVCVQWLLADVELDVEVAEDYERAPGNAVENGRDVTEQRQDGEEAEGQEEGEEVVELEGEEDAIFIPLTFATKLPREYYKGSDPEWQEFRKLAPDKERVQRIFKELSELIANGLLKHRPTLKLLGKNTIVRRYWLDVQFPDGPPQDYVRKGLEIGSNYVAISEQVIAAQNYDRMTRIMWPSGVVNGLYEFWNTIVVLRWRKVKESLGMDTSAKPGSYEYRMDRMVQMVRAHDAAKGPQDAHTDPSASGGPESESEQIDLKPGSRWYLPGIPAFPGDPAENTVATLSFAHSLAQSRNKPITEPPRGNVLIFGMLQATGSQACVTFDVTAHYDPKSSTFSSCTIKAKSVKLWKQSPRGGP